jgi:hypothetical protein
MLNEFPALSSEASWRGALPEVLLAPMPAGDSARFFGGERREKQLRESCFPGERLGFVQREVEYVFVAIKLVAEFSHDLLSDVFDLREHLAVTVHTTIAEIHFGFQPSIYNFSLHNVYLFSSCLFSQIHGQKKSNQAAAGSTILTPSKS